MKCGFRGTERVETKKCCRVLTSVGIPDLKKWGGHFGAKEKSRGAT